MRRLLVLGLLLASCKQEPVPGPAASAVASGAPAPSPAAPTTAGGAASAAALPAASDLDRAALAKTLSCGAGAKAGPCAVVAAFEACAQWNPVVPSGDGRWLGKGSVVADGKTTDELTLLRAKRVPTSDVGAGLLPVKIGLASIAKADPMFEQGERAVRTFERHDVPAKSNTAITHLKQLDAWAEASAQRTKSGQVMFVGDGEGWVCQGPKQQLFLIKRARAGSADGIYAELWPATW
jgi:hypothetical protein